MNEGILIRPATVNDLDEVLRIQNSSYTENYLESRENFKRLIESYPDGNYVLVAKGKIAGYIFSHPYAPDRIQELNRFQNGNKASCIYIHDLAVDMKHRNLGYAKSLLKKIDEITIDAGYDKQALVSVLNSISFWKKMGFDVRKKVTYGGMEAYYMVRIFF